jgi:hypothetical protein
MLVKSMEHTSDIGQVQDRLKDVEAALYSFATLSAVAQGFEKATLDEIYAVQSIFAAAMERIKSRVVRDL